MSSRDKATVTDITHIQTLNLFSQMCLFKDLHVLKLCLVYKIMRSFIVLFKHVLDSY